MNKVIPISVFPIKAEETSANISMTDSCVSSARAKNPDLMQSTDFESVPRPDDRR